ncbi:hypothetical protein ACTSKR_15290 [Chitinibacteraceae bacterium HSL-7]
MLPKRTLNQLLPVRFRNGEQIKQFSKPCVRCGQMLHAKDMEGAARLIDDHLAIAVHARCPSCGERFGVACVVDNEKRVRRVLVPATPFGWYLRSLPPQKGEESALHTVAMDEFEPSQPQHAEAAPVAPAMSARDVVRADESLGRYQGKPIPAWVLVDGRRFEFERVQPDWNAGGDEFVLDNTLVYKLGRG